MIIIKKKYKIGFLKRLHIKYQVKKKNRLETRFVRKLKKTSPNSISDEDLQKIRDINKDAYSGELLDIITDRYFDLKKLCEYCNCIDPVQIRLCVTDNWYITFIHHYASIEIADFAAANGKSNDFMRENVIVWREIRRQGTKPFIACLREKTSYKLIKAFEKRKKLEILYEAPITLADEQFYWVRWRCCG
ncbi:MAG: hypothetical protein IKN85_04170 [Oscillospiraceae bacterium]|nr:hypothetical protein [Oscillospiraceae bacterium]MBR3535006.1 hypothetical protein [Oscillospiraceae bacterium]MBR6835427.1 hypothetical protein [Oscillospiraceae bacterium]MBR6923105.1 hypothetical protein [Oscillospiraceae bacterium]